MVTSLEKRAGRGDAHAAAQLAEIHFRGEAGMPSHPAKALNYSVDAAERNHPMGWYLLGRAYETGLDEVPRDPALSKRYYRKAVQGLGILAQKKMGPYLACALGDVYRRGLGGADRDLRLAHEYYRQASEMEYPRGQYWHAVGCLFGWSGEPQPEKARELLEECERKAYMPGVALKGMALLDGWASYPVSARDARNLFEWAGRHECPAALFGMARLYEDGLAGLERDADSARTYFNRARINALKIPYDQSPVDAFQLGSVLLFGLDGDAQNVTEARPLIEKAALEQYGPASYMLGVMYQEGMGVGENTLLAERWFQDAFAQGESQAAHELARMYFDGAGVPRDLDRAYFYTRQGADAGDPESLYTLGWFYQQGTHGVVPDPFKAADAYRAAMEQGHAKAAFNLAALYEQGLDPGGPDYRKAMKLYKFARKHGEPLADMAMAALHYDGKGTPRNPALAFALTRRTAETGFIPAIVNTARMLETGKGCYRDPGKALNWYELAAEKGDTLSKFKVGYMYETGGGGIKDYRKAVDWYRQAASDGDPESMYRIARMYRGGLGVEQNNPIALSWYRRAADHGSVNAMYDLGMMFHEGVGIERDPVKAAGWFEKAAAMGDRAAALHLGWIYNKGEGVSEDPFKAARYLIDASASGSKEADSLLSLLLNYGM